jgi:hypothetical protein
MPGVGALQLCGRGRAMFFLARKFERSESWFCDDAISTSLVGVPPMKN